VDLLHNKLHSDDVNFLRSFNDSYGRVAHLCWIYALLLPLLWIDCPASCTARYTTNPQQIEAGGVLALNRRDRSHTIDATRKRERRLKTAGEPRSIGFGHRSIPAFITYVAYEFCRYSNQKEKSLMSL